MLKAYLAGPGVFLPDPHTYFSNKRNICLKYNFIGISPFDSELNVDSKTPHEIGRSISQKNEQLMRSSDFIIADLTPYHGVSADVGTAFEVGFMRALDKSLFAYSNISKKFYNRVKETYYCNGEKDILGREQADGMALENFDMYDNLMLDGAISSSKSLIVVGDVADDEIYSSLIIFENTVKYAASVLNK